MIKITLTKAPTSLLECAGYISGRKKLIQAMSLNIDRPINRAVVVGCAIFTTHNYLKLHMSRTLKVLYSCQNAEVVAAFYRVAPVETIPVDQFTGRPLLAFSHACREAHCTIFSPVCRHCTSPRARVTLTIESVAGIKSS
jgi:hypothetical protein